MASLDFIGFDNYRIFNKDFFIKLKQITILTGANSSGKSSLIKAAKLLKQNTPKLEYSGLPQNLEFIPDQYGHYLGDFTRILSHNHKGKKDISFSLPLKLDLLGDNLLSTMVYGPIQSGPNDGIVTLKSFSIYQLKGSHKKLIAEIKGGLNHFYDFYVDLKEYKQRFENDFISYFKKLENADDLFNDFAYYRKYQGNHLIKDITEGEWKDYNSNYPILPFYKLITNEAEVVDDPDHPDFYNLIRENLKELKLRITLKVEEFAKSNNIEFSNAVLIYFKKIEENLFNYINKHHLVFPIDFCSNNTDFTWWRGILLMDRFDEDLVTDADTTNKLVMFDDQFGELMDIYSSCRVTNPKSNRNSELFYRYIQYSIIQSVEHCRQSINSFHFFDSNRIEQLLFYHNSNSTNAFRLIIDFMKNYRSDYTKICEELRQLNIAYDFKVNANENGIYTILLKKGDNWMPLSEFGFGITKIFFLLLAIKTYGTLFIEEPESNLHPDLQSKLADLIINSIESGNQLIIETHSEYLIRKLQYLIATNKLDKGKILINYFNNAEARKKHGLVREIGFRKDGSLEGEFGTGFFDEAAKTIEDIYRHTFYN